MLGSRLNKSLLDLSEGRLTSEKRNVSLLDRVANFQFKSVPNREVKLNSVT